jgi:hypothetical protein
MAQDENPAIRQLLKAAEGLAGSVSNSTPNNREYRSRDRVKPEIFTAKLVLQHAVKGVKGPTVKSSGLSKSATRFGIDQNLITLNRIESTPGLNSGKSTTVYTASVSATEAMHLLNEFDSMFESRQSQEYAAKEQIYNQHKDAIFRTYNIRYVRGEGIIWPSSEVQATVLEELRKYSFPHLEVYLSISAKGTRATRSITLKCMENEELVSVLLQLYADKGFVAKSGKTT